jgi:glycosyltransferase involved in cell wall biosynthesis
MFKRSLPLVSPSGPVVCISANTSWYVLNFRSRLIESLVRDGWQVVVLSPSDRYVDKLSELGARHVPLDLKNSSLNPIRELATIWEARVALQQIDPDLVLTFTPKINIYLSMAAGSLGVPVIANISGLGRASSQGGWLERVTKQLYKRALSSAATVFFQNEEDRAAFITGGLVEAKKTRRLPGSGVDVDRFSPRPKPTKGSFRFLLVARMLWDKGIREFVETARAIRAVRPDVEFALAGFLDVDNPSAVPRSDVEAWEREGVIRYLGSFDDMVPVYAQADCVVLPSYYKEGVPRSLLEAASMGKPVITTDWPGCRDAVQDGVTGFLVKPRDSSDLTGKVSQLIRMSPEDLDRMQMAARRRACSDFNETTVIDAYRQAIGSAVGFALPAFTGTATRNATVLRVDRPKVQRADSIHT